MEAQQVTSGALPTAREFIAAIQANAGPIGEPSGTLHPRGNSPAADSTTVAAANADAAASEAPNAPASVTTTIINELLESGVPMPAPMQQQQPQLQQQSPSNIAQVKYMDQQIAEGNLIRRPGRKIEYMNIMTFGESGLGKTVRPW